MIYVLVFYLDALDIPDDYSGRVWMVDPLDGTKDFVHKGTGFSVMIGLCINQSYFKACSHIF